MATAKQLAARRRFAAAARRGKIRKGAKLSRRSSGRVRVSRETRTRRRRRAAPKKKTTRKGRSMTRGKRINLLKTAAAVSTAALLLKPYYADSNSTVQRALKLGQGETLAAVATRFGEDTRSALGPKNLLPAAAPLVAYKVIDYGRKTLGIPSPRIGKVTVL